ncbi:MAG: hypothetical protein JWM78_2521 [Verrucomicrobiaceae bacterium]|nr:hypothetical protein [Verrucomicrobiaceae bacterium]
MTDTTEPKRSPLCQTIERDGKSVQADIYEDGAGGWVLEAVDSFNNSTVWDDHFKTDKDALDELLDTIEQEGIDVLVATESWQPN